MEKTKESIIEFLKNLDSEDLMHIHNEYVEYMSYYDDEIYLNNEDFFNEFFDNKDIYNIVQRVHFGNFQYNEKFIKYNGYGNLDTTNYIEDWIDFENIANEILNENINIDNY